MSNPDPKQVRETSDELFNELRMRYAGIVQQHGAKYAMATYMDLASGLIAMASLGLPKDLRKQVLEIVVEATHERATELSIAFDAFRAGLDAGRKEAQGPMQ